MRVDKYLSLIFDYSRQTIQDLIKQGHVYIGENKVIKPNEQVHQQVYVQGKKIEEKPYIYLMLNKKEKTISALKDTKKTVIEEIKHPRVHQLRIMGRLDYETTGLMILTNDNSLIKKVTLPDSHVEKEYEVTVRLPLSKKLIDIFINGVVIDCSIKLSPSKLEILDDYHCRVVIKEGKYHQIKKMFLSCHNEVVQLKRIRIHHLCLDPHLLCGEYRELTEKEIQMLKNE